MTGAIVFAALSIPMFIFGRWGQSRAVSLAAAETGEERRDRKERSIRNGAIAWQCVAGIVLLIGILGMVP